MTPKTVVVDYGIGNVFSVCNAIKQVGAEACLTREHHEIRNAERLILPGVGAFARAMDALRSRGLAEPLKDFLATGRPFLGICIGMQVLMNASSEFGEHKGLGIIPGRVERIPAHSPDGGRLRIPHIGWATIRSSGETAERWSGTPLVYANAERRSLYFVHSYHCVLDDDDHRIAFVNYGGHEITAAIRDGNVVGVQFHPERSGAVGQEFLSMFLNI